MIVHAWIVGMAGLHCNQLALSKLAWNCCGLVDIGRVLTTVNSPFSDFPSDKPCESSPSSTDVPQPMFNSCSFEFFLNFHLVLTLNFCDSFCCKESFHIDRHWKPSRKSTKWNEWSFLSARNWHLTQDGDAWFASVWREKFTCRRG